MMNLKSVPALTSESDLTYISSLWLESVCHTVKESTYSRYRSIIDNYIGPDLGNMRPEELSESMLRDYFSCLCDKRGKPLSEKYKADIRSVLSRILNFSEKHGLKNPVSMKNIRIHVPVKSIPVLRMQEQRELVQFLSGFPCRMHAGILISLCTGMRLGEVCGLRREDIALETKILTVRHTLIRLENSDRTSSKKTRLVLSAPKTEYSSREIPIPDFLLDEIFPIVVNDHPGDYFLSGTATPRDPRTLENWFYRACAQAGISRIRFHCLRHTFATNWLEMGSDVKSLSMILGHSSVNVTLTRYAHPSMESRRKNLDKMAEIYGFPGTSKNE